MNNEQNKQISLARIECTQSKYKIWKYTQNEYEICEANVIIFPLQWRPIDWKRESVADESWKKSSKKRVKNKTERRIVAQKKNASYFLNAILIVGRFTIWKVSRFRHCHFSFSFCSSRFHILFVVFYFLFSSVRICVFIVLTEMSNCQCPTNDTRTFLYGRSTNRPIEFNQFHIDFFTTINLSENTTRKILFFSSTSSKLTFGFMFRRVFFHFKMTFLMNYFGSVSPIEDLNQMFANKWTSVKAP